MEWDVEGIEAGYWGGNVRALQVEEVGCIGRGVCRHGVLDGR